MNFSVAVDKRIKPQDGSPTADFFRIKAWGNTADFVGAYLAKGRLVAVDGRLETRKYTDSEGSSREIVEIIADNVQGLDRPRDDGETGPEHAGGGQRSQMPATPQDDTYDPFAE